MSRLILLALAVVIGTLVWFLSTIGADPVNAPVDANARSGARAAQSNLPAQPDADAERVAATSDVDTPTPTAASTLTLRGRCVDPAGEPLANCEAEVRVERDGAEGGEAAARAPQEHLTASDGRFEIAIQHDDWTDTVKLRVAADGRVPRAGQWPRPRSGRTIDVGDIVMLSAIKVDGIMVDQHNRPVADAKAMFVYIPLTEKHEVEAESMLTCRTDQNGRFSFDAPAHVGEWYVGAEGTGALVEPRSVKLGDELSQYELRIVVERPDPEHTIHGRCVDTAGQPIAGMRLSCQGEGFIGRGRSSADGTFAVQRAGPIPDRGKSGVSMSCTDPELRYELAEQKPAGRIPWGAEGIEFVMRTRGRQSVRVIDGQGHPVSEYTLLVFRGQREPIHSMRLTQRGHHPDGRCQLTGLQTGPHTLLVVPRDQRLGISTIVPLTIEPDVVGRELLVSLHPRAPLDIEVVSAEGRAMAASSVELVLCIGEDRPPPVTVADLPDLRAIDGTRRTPRHVVVASATTDDRGTATLSAPRGTFYLRCTGTEHVAHVQQVQPMPPRTTTRCVVQSAAQLHGVLQPPEAFARLQQLAEGGDEPIAVVVTPEGGKALPPAVPDARGNYRIGGLPTGSYSVKLRYWLRTGEVRAGSVTLPITELDLAAGTDRELLIEVSGFLPGTVSGRVVAGGEPLRDVHCFLRRNGPGRVTLRVATDSDGRYRGLVPPGDYGFAITYPAQPGPGWLHMVLPDEWQVAPGGEHVANFDVPLRRVRVQLQDAEGRPQADVRTRVRRTGYSLPGGLKSDANGWVEIYPAPFDAFELVELDGEKRTFGPIDLPPAQTEGEVRCRPRAN